MQIENQPVGKPRETSNNLRKVFILFLIFTFLITAGSLVLRHSIFQKLDTLSNKLQGHAEEQEISTILLDLNDAESDFQQAVVSGKTQSLDNYKKKLNGTFIKIAAILKKYGLDSTSTIAAGKKKISESFEQKLEISKRVFELKHNFDSLLTITTIEAVAGKGTPEMIEKYQLKRSIRRTTGKPDTSVQMINPASGKKGLFKRIQDAIVNRQEHAQSIKVVTVNRDKQIRDSINRSLIRRQRNSEKGLLMKLNEENSRLAKSNQQLISANLSLVIRLHELVQQLKEVHRAEWEITRSMMFKQYELATDDMNTFTGVAIAMVLIFIVLLLVYIGKAAKAENKYLLENERAIALAEQKSEMLAIMSHEIRNPLTAITGTIYLLNRGEMTAEQQKKVNSINLSSNLLINTVNSILDLSKFDNQKAAGLTMVDFLPEVEIKEAVDAMAFGAERKGISLNMEFNGDTAVLVKGDPFRLKQVMINLLSNAIKYTDRGGVSVKVNLKQVANLQQVLQVSIIDTGMGIPKEQQAKLFTRYYQANRSSGKPGTGLGLYICRQLVEIQKGKISLESEEGKGSHFKFEIPYQLPE